MCQLFKVVKEKTGMTGNQIAKAIGESPELVSRWNTGKSDPNGINTLKLMKLADLDRDEAMKLVEKGSIKVSAIITLAFASLLLFATCQTELQAAEMLNGGDRQVIDSYIHYAKYMICMVMATHFILKINRYLQHLL